MIDLYKSLMLSIKISSENISDSKMSSVYSLHKSKMDEVNKYVSEIYMRYGNNGVLKLSATQRNFLKTDIKEKLTDIGKQLGQYEIYQLADILKEVYKNTYYQVLFVMEQGVSINFKLISDEILNAAVNEPYLEERFSDRVWKNKTSMVNQLKTDMLDMMKGSKTFDQVAKNIKNRFSVAAYQSNRLMRTETARIHTQASINSAKNSGVVEEIMWVSTLDEVTRPEDASLDGKRWPLNSEHPVPPLHPNCRCCIILVVDGWKPSKRFENSTGKTIDYTEYNNWLKNKGAA